MLLLSLRAQAHHVAQRSARLSVVTTLLATIACTAPALGAGSPVSKETTGAAHILTDLSATLDFGAREIYLGRERRQFTLENTGTAPLTWTGVGLEINSATPQVFEITPTTASLPMILPGTSHTLTISMDPDAEGAVTGSLNIYTNASNQSTITVALTGEGTLPQPIDWAQYAGGPERRARQFFDSTVDRFDAPIWQTPAEDLYGAVTPIVVEYPGDAIPVRVYSWGTDSSGAFAKGFNGDTGELLWKSDPITSEGNTVGFGSWHSMGASKANNMVFLGMGAYIHAFDGLTGHRIWTSDPLRGDGGTGDIVNASVVVGDDYVYQTNYTGFGGTNYLQAFNITDGTEAWHYEGMGQGQETPVYHNDGLRPMVFRMSATGSYPAGGTGITCHDAATGEIIWTHEAPLDGGDPWFAADANFGGISFYDGLLYVPTYNFGGVSEFFCVDAYTGALKWIAHDSVATDTSPVVIGDRVFVCGHFFWGGGSDVVAYNRHTGEQEWVTKVSESSNMWTVNLAATNDALYFTEGTFAFGTGQEDGLHKLDPATGAELGTVTELSRKAQGSVAIGSDGSLYTLYAADATGNGGLLCYRAPRVASFAIEGHTSDTLTPIEVMSDVVTVTHDASWATEMRVYESGEAPGAWVPYFATSSMVLSAGDGEKTFIAEYRNGAGETTAQRTMNIVNKSSVSDWLIYE